MSLTDAEVLEGCRRMSNDKRQEMAARIAAKQRHRKAHPLAYATLWHSAKTSQRDAVACVFDPSVTEVWMLGGNRSGKSEGAAMTDIVWALGRDHPDSQAWAARNGIDISCVQPGPGLVYNGAPTGNDSRRYVRPKIRKYCPEGTTYRSWGSDNEAEATLPNGGRIVCKTVKQGREGWQGDACHYVRFDEEPSDGAVVREAMARLIDFDGKICFSMTPLNGWTDLLESHVRTPDPDVRVRWLHGEDNPHIPNEALNRILSKFGAHERDARLRGEIVALEGRVFTDWRRDMHVIPSQPIPDDWLRFVGWDFGTRNPTAVVWMAHDPKDDVVHVYRLHYEADRTLAWHAERFTKLSEGEAIEFVCADSADRGARLSLVQEGITTVASRKGPNSIRDGINTIAARLAPDAEGRPHLVIHECCTELIKEIESYRWDTTKKKGDMADAPLKKQDHAIDAMRYALTMFQRGGYV